MPDYFERLGLPRRFSVDPATIEREYLARSREVHPDFHRLGSSAEQQASLELSAALNEAYVTIKDPFRRADYLLGLLGGPSAQQEKDLDQTFLLEMMDLRERIDEAKAGGEDLSDENLFETELVERENDHLAWIAGEFDRLDKSPADDPNRADHLINIRRSLNAMKTIQSLLHDMRMD